MAEMALAVQVFVASSSDVAHERKLIHKELKAAQRRIANRRILLQPFLWEVSTGAYTGDPQTPLTEELRRSEFAIIVLWSRIGPGTEAELRHALDPQEGHRFDNVAIYFKSEEPPLGTDSDGWKQVREVERKIQSENLALTREFRTEEELRSIVRAQINSWLDLYWIGLPEACEFALRHSGPVSIGHRSAELRWHRITERFDYAANENFCLELGRWAVNAYSQYGTNAAGLPIPAKLMDLHPDWNRHIGNDPSTSLELQRISESIGSPVLSLKPLCRFESEVIFSDLEWFYFFCSFGLAEAVQMGNQQPIVRRPFINAIHQYLKANVAARGIDLSRQLVEWLSNRLGRTAQSPVVRNFAAYVLGTLEIREAADSLAESLKSDPDPDVRRYCITSLGKLKSRRHRPILMREFATAQDPGMRLTISQSLCRMIGLVDFEL